MITFKTKLVLKVQKTRAGALSRLKDLSFPFFSGLFGFFGGALMSNYFLLNMYANTLHLGHNLLIGEGHESRRDRCGERGLGY